MKYGMKMAFSVYSHMFHMFRAWAAYNVVHLFLVVYGIWNMVCCIWYENDIHSVFTYVLHALHSGCLQCSASIPCFNDRNTEICEYIVISK